MPHDSWVLCNQELSALISLLLRESDYVVQEVVEEYDDMVEREPEVKDGKTERVKIAGGLIGLVENLDNEVRL
jgi:translation initiation factor 3 subunit C